MPEKRLITDIPEPGATDKNDKENGEKIFLMPALEIIKPAAADKI